MENISTDKIFITKFTFFHFLKFSYFSQFPPNDSTYSNSYFESILFNLFRSTLPVQASFPKAIKHFLTAMTKTRMRNSFLYKEMLDARIGCGDLDLAGQCKVEIRRRKLGGTETGISSQPAAAASPPLCLYSPHNASGCKDDHFVLICVQGRYRSRSVYSLLISRFGFGILRV